MKYKQLTEGLRYQISLLIGKDYSISSIAKEIGVHKSTISREIKRNQLESRYCPVSAHQKCLLRRHLSAKRKIDPTTVIWVETLLEFKWSPEQISAVCHRINAPVSHQWIYDYINLNKIRGGTLYKHLRQGKRKYRKGSGKRQGPIPNAVSIELRPDIVNNRSRLGDWEADLVLGKQGTGAIVTLAERKSRLYLAMKVPSKEAQVVSAAIIQMLQPYKHQAHTITFDNGGEFSEHGKIAKALDLETYFAHPFSSHKRGLNENTNGLLRQYIPKGTDLRTVSDEALLAYQNALNNRPKKCLGFRAPLAVFNELKKVA